MRRFRIHDQLIEPYAYPQLSDEVKAQIFGLNAAKLFGVDPQAKRREIRADKLTSWRRATPSSAGSGRGAAGGQPPWSAGNRNGPERESSLGFGPRR
jgi:hypothetical protein